MKVSLLKYFLVGSLGLLLSACNSGSTNDFSPNKSSKFSNQSNSATQVRSTFDSQENISNLEKLLFEKKFGYKANATYPDGIIFDIEKVIWPFAYGMTTAITPHEKLPFKLMIYNRGTTALQKIQSTLFIEMTGRKVVYNNTCEQRIIGDQGCELSGYFIAPSYEVFGNQETHPETLFSSINDSEAIRHAWSGYPNQDQDGLYKMRKFNDLVSLTINFYRESDEIIEKPNQFQMGEYHSSVMLENKENSSNDYNDVFTSKIRPSKLFTISQGTYGPIIKPNIAYSSPDFYDKNHQQILACNRLAFADSQCPSTVYLKFTLNKSGKEVFLPYKATLQAIHSLPINLTQATRSQIFGRPGPIPNIDNLGFLEPFLNFHLKLEYIGDELTELANEIYPGVYVSKIKITHYVTNTKMPILVEDIHLRMEF